MVNYEICCSKNLITMEKLMEEILKFASQQSNFKSTVAIIDHYQCIFRALQNPFAETHISFCTFSASDFEDFLLPFQ